MHRGESCKRSRRAAESRSTTKIHPFPSVGGECAGERGIRRGVYDNMKRRFVQYNPKLKTLARQLRRDGTLSEVLLWKELKGKQIMGYDFHRQKPIGQYIVDFYCPRLELAIEIDGDSHIFKEKRDKERQQRLEELGIRFLRFDDLDVKFQMDKVLDTIREWAEREESKGNGR